MGCVLGREVSSGVACEGKEEKREAGNGRSNLRVESSEALDVVVRNVENGNGSNEIDETQKVEIPRDEKRRTENPRSSNLPKHRQGEQVAAGWPRWLSDVVGEALDGWLPRCADSFEKIEKIGQGTYSNVYKARDNLTGKIVALKKVRFDNSESESVKFMAREIIILRRLDHPNVIKLEGLVTSRMSCSLYLVFEYMEHDLAGLATNPHIKFTTEQVKCYMHQLLSGLEHCHKRNVLHRDIKDCMPAVMLKALVTLFLNTILGIIPSSASASCTSSAFASCISSALAAALAALAAPAILALLKGSNLLLDNGGILKIADFGLATVFNRNHKHHMTSRVVTLWYRPPELLLGATNYSVGIDLWSAGCILAELLAGKPIMPGRTEIEQLHKIYNLCGSPSDEYWKKSKLPNAALFRPQKPYKRSISETFKAFPPSSLPLIETLLAIDPVERKTATDALRSEFFTTEPYACDPSSLPKYHPSKELDAKRRDDEARRVRAASKAQGDGAKRTRARDRAVRAFPAPEANAELQYNLDRRRLVSHANAMSKSEKFPPPHEDGGLGVPLGASHHINPTFLPGDVPYSSTSFTYSKEPPENWSGPLVEPASAGGARQKRHVAN